MFGSSRIGWVTLAAMCRRLGMSLAAGLEARQVFQREAQHGSQAHRSRLSIISHGLERGESVSQAMRHAEDYFPRIVHQLVAVGEHAGRLDEVFARLADHYEHRVRLRRVFLLGILWPAIQLAAAVIIVGVLIWISGWLSRFSGQPVDLLGLGLVGTQGLVIYSLSVLAVVFGGWLLVRSAGRRAGFAEVLMRLVMRTPVVGPCVRWMALERMAWSLSIAAKSGLDARQTLELSLESTENPALVCHLGAIQRKITAGQEIHEALRATGVFPLEFVDAVEVGERAGRLEETMERMAKEYEDRARSASSGLAVVAAFVIWGLVAVVMVALILRLGLSYVGMIQSVTA